MTTKRILSLILCMALCFAMLPVSAFAEDEPTADPISVEESVPVPDAISDEPDGSTESVDMAEHGDAVEYYGTFGKTYISEPDRSDETPLQLRPLLRVSDQTNAFQETEPLSREEAIAVFSDAIVQREEVVTLRYRTFWSEDLDRTSFVYAEYYDLVHRACAHDPDKSDAGDYRFYNIRSYAGTVSTAGSAGSVTTLKFTYTLEYYTSCEQELWVADEIAGIVEDFGFTDESDYEKLCRIYDWVCANVVYSQKVGGSYPPISYSAYSALAFGNAVCQGFSALLYRLCLECGMDSRIVTSKSMNHAYNILRLDGLYYYADTTWDYTRYPNDYDYFLRGSVNWVKDIPASHELGDEFADTAFAAAYPVSLADYIPVGDMNGDRTVGRADVLLLMDYVKARGIGVTLLSNGDMTGDGSIGNADIIRLMKLVKDNVK